MAVAVAIAIGLLHRKVESHSVGVSSNSITSLVSSLTLGSHKMCHHVGRSMCDNDIRAGKPLWVWSFEVKPLLVAVMSIAIAALGRDSHGSLALLASCKKRVSGARAKVSLHGRSRHRRSCCRPRYSIPKVTVLSGGIPHRVSGRVDRSCIIGPAMFRVKLRVVVATTHTGTDPPHFLLSFPQRLSAITRNYSRYCIFVDWEERARIESLGRARGWVQ